MISSPLLNELVRTLRNLPAQSDGLANTIQSVRVAEAGFSRAVDDMIEAVDEDQRRLCITRRNRAMQDLILALQSLQQVLERDAA